MIYKAYNLLTQQQVEIVGADNWRDAWNDLDQRLLLSDDEPDSLPAGEWTIHIVKQ